MNCLVLILNVGLICTIWVVKTLGQVNLALNKVAYQTDTSGDYFASLVVDGNPSYNFNDGTCSRTLSNDASWEVDLGAVYFVGSVEIYNRVDCCSNDLRDIEIYTGLTRDTYQFVGTRPGPAGLAVIFSPLTMPEFQWLKISRKAGSKAPLTLCEVKVFPSDVTTTQASDVTTTQAYDVTTTQASDVTTTQSADATTMPSNGGQGSCSSNLRYMVDATRQGTSVTIATNVAMSKILCSAQCRLTAGCQNANFNHDVNQCILLQSSDFVANTDDNTVMITPISE